MGKQKERKVEINREGNLAARQLGSLCQFVQTEEARVAVQGQVTGHLADHTYASDSSLIPLLRLACVAKKTKNNSYFREINDK